MRIKVIDAICGAGKSSYAFQMMNDFSRVGFGTRGDYFTSQKKFIYVTPFLSEVARVINNTKAEFSEPTNKNSSKYEHVKKLIEEGKSIVMTHELFSRLDEETMSDIKVEGYTLIMDEVANVLEQVQAYYKDIEYLLKAGAIEINDNKEIIWMDDDYEVTENSKYRDIKVLAERGNLFLDNGNIVFWTMPVNSFLCFDEVYLLTYLFDGQIQKYYYDLHGVEYEKYSVQKKGRYELIQYNPILEPRNEIKQLLDIYEDYNPQTGRKSCLNSNYDSRRNPNKYYQLSGTWLRKASDEDLKQLKNNLINFFRNQCPTDNEKVFWTTLKEVAPKLKNSKCKFNGDRSKDNYTPLNIRATNDYADCTAMAYIYNRFMNPMEKRFFENRGIKVDQDLLAMSDLIQFMFRGSIRKGEPMACYIPSMRMRSLLTQWFEYSEGSPEYEEEKLNV
ncbi:DEAD/DEAH box helicase family protein [Peribacillus simplex]|uniref:DEAD/DEAH box helicase family protein n=1 Tax=Peribacillus simplex TaxID=1478 RepID=UPI003D29A926